jgi:DNA-directed RNA polymerase sigma subunit (sigma70/sigma32)
MTARPQLTLFDPSADHRQPDRDLEAAIERVIRDLPPLELQLVRMRYGVGTPRRPPRDIARRLGVSRGRIRRLEILALRDLRALSMPRDVPRRPAAARHRGAAVR